MFSISIAAPASLRMESVASMISGPMPSPWATVIGTFFVIRGFFSIGHSRGGDLGTFGSISGVVLTWFGFVFWRVVCVFNYLLGSLRHFTISGVGGVCMA